MKAQISIFRFNRSNPQAPTLVDVTEEGGAIILTPSEARKIAFALIDAAGDAEKPRLSKSELTPIIIELSKES